MKRIIALCLVLCSMFSFALSEAPAQEDAQVIIEEASEEMIEEAFDAIDYEIDGEANEESQMVKGFVIDNDAFFAMEEYFRTTDFSGEMSSVELSETQALIFNPSPVDHLLPTLSVTITEADPFSEDANELAATVGSIVGVMQYLQEQFPDTFLFNNEMVSLYEGVGLGYLVAEPELWLWPESAGAVFVPVCFYENQRGTLIDDMYLLEVLAIEDGGLCYILYNDPQRVADYMEHVTVNADASPFQYALAFWYLKNYMLTSIDLEQEQGAAGMLRILNTLCFVREAADTGSRIVARVKRGEWYPVLTVSENGWYEIRCTDGTIGFISPNLVEFFPREVPDLREEEEEVTELDGAEASEELTELEETQEGEIAEETEESVESETPAESAEATKQD